MTSFKKTLRPFTTDIDGRIVSVFVFVEFDGRKLSITGVEGPKSNGDAHGACGQIDMHEWTPHTFAEGWNADMAVKLRKAWSDWHMNDCRAYSPEMKAAGWIEKAEQKFAGHEFTLTMDSIEAKKAAEKAALTCLRAGEPFIPTPEQVQAAMRPYSLIIWQPEVMAAPAAPEGYHPARHAYGHSQGTLKRPDVKAAGWLRPEEHPEGLLGRKLRPGDSHGYGGKWWHEDVPQDVLQWLQSLPDADKPCPGSWGH